MDTSTPAALIRPAWPLAYAVPPLGALRTAPRLARAVVRSTLGLWGLQDMAEVAETLTSELVTNALNASTDRQGQPLYDNDGQLLTIGLVLRTDSVRLRVEVWDRAEGEPARKEPGELDVSGRGLAMVDFWTRSHWGWAPRNAQAWKHVYAELAHPIPEFPDEQGAGAWTA
jgi:hypothetical protein